MPEIESARASGYVANSGKGEGIAIFGDFTLAIFGGSSWLSRLLVANQVALATKVEQEQFADRSHLDRCSRTQVRVQLDIVSADASIPVWFHLCDSCREKRDLRAWERNVIRQQQ